MEIAQTILKQISMMYILMLAGFILYRKNMINDEGTLQMSNLLLWVVNPMLMITRYQMEFSLEKLIELGTSLVLAFLVMVFGIIVGLVFVKRDKKIDQFAIAFANGGFMGIPLVSNILRGDSVFYLSAYLACFAFLSYTYGIYLVSGDKKEVSLKKVLRNPGVIGVMIGLLVFISPIKLPEVLYNACNTVGNINTPLAMIILGTYIAKSKLVDLFTDKNIYYVCFIKLIMVPLLTVLLLKFIPDSLYDIKMVMYIAISTPVGVTIPMLSQLYGNDYEYGARVVGLSTILSLITIPLMIILPGILW